MRVPLRARLTLAFAAGMAVVLGAFGAFLYLRVAHDLLAGIDMQLRSRAQVLVGAIRDRQPGLIGAEGSLIDPDEAFAQVLTPADRIVDSSSAVRGRPMLTEREVASLRGPRFVSTRVQGVDDPARLLAVPERNRGGRLVVVVGATLGDRDEALARLLLALAIGGPLALALVSWAGWTLAGAALRPVGHMAREAAAISLSEPGRRLPVSPTGDELAHLGTTLNLMLDRLEDSVQREQQFLDRASHELRTPLSVLRMELDLALAKARSEEELRVALQNASAETDRLVRLAQDLLVLSRARHGVLTLHRRDTPIDELLQRARDAHRARAQAAGVHMQIDCHTGLRARIDPERMRQAVDDLLDNALRHSSPGGTITLSAARADGTVRFSVLDSGPGFPPELLDGLPDGRPATLDGGASPATGLGLPIVSAIAMAHGGTLRLENPVGGGARANLELTA
jgi:two-component system, OmpR family, sensor kinase